MHRRKHQSLNVKPRKRQPPAAPRRPALWEWLILGAIVSLLVIQLFLGLTGRPGMTRPGWVDAPPYYPGR